MDGFQADSRFAYLSKKSLKKKWLFLLSNGRNASLLPYPTGYDLSFSFTYSNNFFTNYLTIVELLPKAFNKELDSMFFSLCGDLIRYPLKRHET